MHVCFAEALKKLPPRGKNISLAYPGRRVRKYKAVAFEDDTSE